MSQKIKMVCLECETKFSSANLLPNCPKCGGSDIEPANEFLDTVAPYRRKAPRPELPVILRNPARYRVTTNIPYFNHTKLFESFESMQRWVLTCTGVNLPAAPEAAALGKHKTARCEGEVTVEAVR
ncbi:MAG TPA: hypothetical protein VND65_01785 [Candidatus Binatia bacterium]|nr:hypothetical protein [Candidatus Binatia bacterium]